MMLVRTLDMTLRKLKIIYFAPIALALVLVLCFETDLLPVGVWAGCEQGEFVVVTTMELLTVVTIPLTLRFVKTPIKRIGFILGPMVVNTLLYYLFMAVPFGYLAIILVLAGVFVYPKKKVVE